jgi:hypothetical protein
MPWPKRTHKGRDISPVTGIRRNADGFGKAKLGFVLGKASFCLQFVAGSLGPVVQLIVSRRRTGIDCQRSNNDRMVITDVIC